MKKMFTAVMALGMIVSSCGDSTGDASEGDGAVGVGSAGELTVCDCIDIQIAMMKDMLKGMSEEEAGSKYVNEMDSCKALGEGKSPEELEAMKEQSEDCESMVEMQKLSKELMTKMMSEQMIDQGSSALGGVTDNLE